MLTGIAASGGFAIGKIFWLEQPDVSYSPLLFRGEGEETRRLREATAQFGFHTEQTMASLRRIVGEKEAAIFRGHIWIADDPDMRREMRQRIFWGLNAQTAVETACDTYIESFLNSPNRLTRQRAADIKDVKHALLSLLNETAEVMPQIPFGSVLAAKELTPSAVRFLDRRRTVAIVTEHGDKVSHLAILAAAMGIPAVLSVKDLSQSVANGQKVIVDGNKGEIIKIS